MALVTVSSARCRRIRTPRSSRVNQATCKPCSTACWPRASSRNVLPVPDGPQTTRFSLRCTHSRVRSACWVGAGIEEASGFQASKVFPVGNAAAARRVASADRSRPATSSANRARSTSTGSQRWALAVATPPGRRRGCAASAAAAAGPRTSSGSGGADGIPAAGTGVLVVADMISEKSFPDSRLQGSVGWAARRGGGQPRWWCQGQLVPASPRAAQPPVPWVRIWSRRPAGRLGWCRAWGGGQDRGQVVPRRSGRAPRRARAPSRRGLGLASLAMVTACAIFTRIREVPGAAASVSHTGRRRRWRGTRPRPGAWASGSRCSAPGGAGGKCSSSMRGLPGSARRCRATSTGPAVADVDDDHLLVAAGAVDPDPHRLPEQLLRHRVLAVLEGRPSACSPRPAGSPRTPPCAAAPGPGAAGPLLVEHLGRHPAGHPMHPGVDLLMNASHAASSSRERGVLRRAGWCPWAPGRPWRASRSAPTRPWWPGRPARQVCTVTP